MIFTKSLIASSDKAATELLKSFFILGWIEKKYRSCQFPAERNLLKITEKNIMLTLQNYAMFIDSLNSIQLSIKNHLPILLSIGKKMLLEVKPV